MPGYYWVRTQNSHLGYTSTAQMGQFQTHLLTSDVTARASWALVFSADLRHDVVRLDGRNTLGKAHRRPPGRPRWEFAQYRLDRPPSPELMSLFSLLRLTLVRLRIFGWSQRSGCRSGLSCLFLAWSQYPT